MRPRSGPATPRNWAAYNKAPIGRDSLTVRIDQDALDPWDAEHDPDKRGRPFVYSDAAVEMVLILRELYRPPLRAAQGFARSILDLMGVDLDASRVPELLAEVGGASTRSRRTGRTIRSGVVA